MCIYCISDLKDLCYLYLFVVGFWNFFFLDGMLLSCYCVICCCWLYSGFSCREFLDFKIIFMELYFF